MHIHSTSVFIKVFVNNKEVVKTFGVPLEAERLLANFRDTEFSEFAVQIQDNPREIHAEVWEKGLHGEIKLTNLALTFPGIQVLFCFYPIANNSL